MLPQYRSGVLVKSTWPVAIFVSGDFGDHTKLRFFSKLPPKNAKDLEHTLDFFATLDGRRSKLGHCLLPFIATLGDEHTPFRDCIFFRKGTCRSAIAAVTPDGSSNWIRLQRISRRSKEGRVSWPGWRGGTRAALRRVGFSAEELDDCSARWRSAVAFHELRGL